MTPYILDTNVLVHFVRRDAVWGRINRQLGLLLADPMPAYSTVTAGELRSLAFQFGWGDAKWEEMEFALGYFGRMPVEPEIVIHAYAEIDATMAMLGHPMGKNDLWIAAGAAAYGMALVTTDLDFDRLDPVFLSRIYIDPSAP